MLQLILHLIGDYLLQSDWMAQNKTKCSKAAAAHAITYSLPFLILEPSVAAFSVICITHLFIYLCFCCLFKKYFITTS